MRFVTGTVKNAKKIATYTAVGGRLKVSYFQKDGKHIILNHTSESKGMVGETYDREEAEAYINNLTASGYRKETK